MSLSFDLLTQPWLPCLPLDSETPVMVTLPDVLAKAHQYREVVADSPLVNVALHRMLLAIVHRAYMGPRTRDDWRVLWDRKRFDADLIRAYLMDTRWRTHFDLFDERRPFYQVPAMEKTDPVSVAKLSIERASGNNITLFDHTTGGTAAFTPAEAARYLIAFQLYAVGGGVSTPFNLSDGPLARDYTVLVRGQTLFETLMLNLQRYDDETFLGRTLSDDSAWWERERDPEPEREGTTPRGYCDYLTWQSRRVRLVHDESANIIRLCQVRQNLKLSPTLIRPDPFKAYRSDDKRGWISRRLGEEKAIWRDSHALLEEVHNEGSRPECFQWLAELFPARRLRSGREFAFEVIGYLTDGPQTTVVLWRRERLPLPLSYLAPEGKPLRDELRTGLETAEAVSRLFRPGRIPAKQDSGKAKAYPSPVWVLAKESLTMSPDRKPDAKDINALADHLAAERTFWASLEPAFRRFMLDLTKEPAAGQAVEEYYEAVLAVWKEKLRAIAHRVFDELVGALETNMRSMRAAALAQRQFRWLLNEVLPAAQREPAPAERREQ